MLILIVSANPLFKEVINEIIAQGQAEILELPPEDALTRLCEIKPQVIIVDEKIPTPWFENLLAEARNLQKTRLIVLNPVQNEILLMDWRREMMRQVDDLKEAITSYGSESQPGREVGE